MCLPTLLGMFGSEYFCRLGQQIVFGVVDIILGVADIVKKKKNVLTCGPSGNNLFEPVVHPEITYLP